MTEEQKEYEAMKLVNMFDKLSRYCIVAAFDGDVLHPSSLLFAKVYSFKYCYNQLCRIRADFTTEKNA